MYNISLNENSLTFKELERRNYKYACYEACRALSEVLQSLDERFLRERDSKGGTLHSGSKKVCGCG